MVNFRYHVISLIAVFLALSVGIIMGTTVISEGVVSQLRRDAHDFAQRNKQLRADTDRLDGRLGFYEKSGSTMVAALVKGKLDGRGVTLLIQEGAPKTLVDHVADALKLAGANPPSRVTLTNAWTLADDPARGKLASALGVTPADGKTLQQSAGRLLGERLTQPADPGVDTDLIRRLSTSGFIRLSNLPAGVFPPSLERLLVVIPSGVKGSAPAQEAFFSPLLSALSAKRFVAVAEPLGAEESLAVRVRGDGTMHKTISSVDDADTAPGQISLVWALRAQTDGRGALHFGVLDGANGIVPDVTAG